MYRSIQHYKALNKTRSHSKNQEMNVKEAFKLCVDDIERFHFFLFVNNPVRYDPMDIDNYISDPMDIDST